MSNNGQDWVGSILENTPGYESEVFRRYAHRLLAFARSRLPADISGRVDEDDIVQSVFLSFFKRNGNGQFSFDSSYDVWSLLAAMTYRKVLNVIEFHHRERRNTKKEVSASDCLEEASAAMADTRFNSPEELTIMVDYLQWILDRLTEDQRAIVRSRMQGFSIVEVSQQVGLSTRTVKRTLGHVRSLALEKMACELH